jgi:hypothetical protein
VLRRAVRGGEGIMSDWYKWKSSGGGPGLVMPAFKREQEEADWWFDNREIVEDRILKYGQPGAVSGEHLPGYQRCL